MSADAPREAHAPEPSSAPAAYVQPRAHDIDTATGPTEAAAIIANSGQKPPP